MKRYKESLRQASDDRKALLVLHGWHWHTSYSLDYLGKIVRVHILCDDLAPSEETFSDDAPRCYKIEDPVQVESLIIHLVEINLSLLEKRRDYYEKSGIQYYKDRLEDNIDFQKAELEMDIKMLRAHW